MRLASPIAAAVLLTFALSSSLAGAAAIREEHVTGGHMDLVWLPGFGVNRMLIPGTLAPADPAYANPSGDHTVGVLVNSAPDSGGIALSATDPAGQADYVWEGWMFTGNGDTRRGLVLRANPLDGFQESYQFVLNSGMAQLVFRKLSGQAPTVLGSWLTFNLPSGVPALNSWHHMKVIAEANAFRCFWDNLELTDPQVPILDTSSPLLTGWVGVYNFRFDAGGIPVYFDDLILSPEVVVPTASTTWGHLKALYR